MGGRISRLGSEPYNTCVGRVEVGIRSNGITGKRCMILRAPSFSLATTLDTGLSFSVGGTNSSMCILLSGSNKRACPVILCNNNCAGAVAACICSLGPCLGRVIGVTFGVHSENARADGVACVSGFEVVTRRDYIHPTSVSTINSAPRSVAITFSSATNGIN